MTIKDCIFAVESLAHLQGKEAELLPLVEAAKQQPTAADLIGHTYYVPSNMKDDDMLDDEDRPY